MALDIPVQNGWDKYGGIFNFYRGVGRMRKRKYGGIFNFYRGVGCMRKRKLLTMVLVMVSVWTFMGCGSPTGSSGTKTDTDSTTVKQKTEIDLNSYKGATHGVNATRAVYKDGFLYVALQRLEIDFTPKEKSLVLKIDPATDSIVASYESTAGNVQDLDWHNGELWLCDFGNNHKAPSAFALSRIDPKTGTATAQINTKVNGGIFSSIEFVSDSVFYGICYRAWGDAPVYGYDLNTSTVIDTVLGISAAGDIRYNAQTKELAISDGATVHMYSPSSKSTTTIISSEHPVSAIAVLPNGDMLLSEVSADYTSGQYSYVTTEGAYQSKKVISSDARAVYSNGISYILERSSSDNIIITNSDGGIEYQVTLGESGFNAHDVVTISDTKAYVLSYGLDKIVVLNPETGKLY